MFQWKVCQCLAPAILRPCTPLYAHVRPVRPQITPSTPIAPMGVHGRTLYAHKKFVRPHNCMPMGVHGRTCTPTKKIPTIFCGRTMYASMYAHKKKFMGVQCTPTKKYVRPQKWLLSEVHFLLCPDSLALTDA